MRTSRPRIGSTYWYERNPPVSPVSSEAEDYQDVCDRVGAEDSGCVAAFLNASWVPALISLSFRAKDAVASMIKRLAHRNANVQLYTLEV